MQGDISILCVKLCVCVMLERNTAEGELNPCVDGAQARARAGP